MISEDFNMTEIFITLTEVIRDNFRNAKLKQHLLPALGEFLFYAATQEENLGCQISQWDAPGQIKQLNNNITMKEMLYAVRCLKSNEDMILALAGQFKQLSPEPEKFRLLNPTN